MSRFLNRQFRALEAYVPGEQPRDMQYIKLNTNESPYPPAPSVAAAMTMEQLKQLRLYSDPTAAGLKRSLAQLYGVGVENVFVSNGSDEVLNFAFMAFGGSGVVYPRISYGFYKVFGDLYGLKQEQIPLREDFSLDFRDYCCKHKMIVIANPNAPTGMSIGIDEIEMILQTNPDSLVLIDEAYVDFGGESCLPLIGQYDNLLVVRTFSKSRCLAGGRLGYAFASPAIIEDLEKIKYSTNPYNINRLTLLLGEATVKADSYYLEKCAEIIQTRVWTSDKLQEMGFTVLPSKTNFVFAKTDKMDGEQLYEQLKSRGILVRHFRDPQIAQFNRITIGTRRQMEILIRTLEDILSA